MALVLVAIAALAGCTPAPKGVEFFDPYETQNREMHDFNIALDRAVLRPSGEASRLIPEPARKGIIHFTSNMSLPGMVLNGLLQGDLKSAGRNTARFLINSTIGLAGLLDPAGSAGLYEETTDFGETLAVWGFQEGAYVELPVLGPSTERDAIGSLFDLVLNPIGYTANTQQLGLVMSSKVLSAAIEREDYADLVDSILYESADSYAQSRLIYLQNRRFQLADGSTDAYFDPYADPYGDLYIDPYEELQ